MLAGLVHKVLAVKFKVLVDRGVLPIGAVAGDGQVGAEEVGVVDAARYQIGAVKLLNQLLRDNLILLVDVDPPGLEHIQREQAEDFGDGVDFAVVGLADGQDGVVFGDDVQLAGELEAVAALHQHALTEVKFRVLHPHVVPAQAKAGGGSVLRQEGSALHPGHLGLAFLADDVVLGQEQVAELAQVGHGGGEAAAALQVEAFGRFARFAHQRIVRVLSGGDAGGVRADRLGDVLFTEFAKVHPRHLGDQHLGQGKAVVAVGGILAGVGLQVALGEVVVDLLIVLLVVRCAHMGGREVFPLGAWQAAGVV